MIYLVAKPNFKLAPKANAHGDVWEFAQELKNPHPAPFPVALIERIIGSTNAQIVLDPFMGSGTTAIAAMNLDRSWIGIELSKKYCDLADERIKNHAVQASLIDDIEVVNQPKLLPKLSDQEGLFAA